MRPVTSYPHEREVDQGEAVDRTAGARDTATCRITGRDSSVLGPVLIRAGLGIAGPGPADVEVRSGREGYVGLADGRRTDLPDVTAVFRWARALPTGPRAIRRADPAEIAATPASVIGAYLAVDDSGEPFDSFHDDPDALAEAVRRVGAKFGMAEARAAASTLQFLVAAGLWSVALGALARGGVVPDLDGLRYRLGEDASVRLALGEPGGWTTTDDPAPLLLSAVVEEHLKPFHARLRTVAKVAEGLLWGNAAAALRSALRPLPAGLHDLGARLLTTAELRDTVSPDGARRSCCLFYRTPTGHTCRTCPLVGATVIRQRGHHA